MYALVRHAARILNRVYSQTSGKLGQIKFQVLRLRDSDI